MTFLSYSASYDDYVKHVRMVLAGLIQYRLFVKVKKCEFHQNSITFLGYVISQKVVKMDEGKVRAVTE